MLPPVGNAWNLLAFIKNSVQTIYVKVPPWGGDIAPWTCCPTLLIAPLCEQTAKLTAAAWGLLWSHTSTPNKRHIKWVWELIVELLGCTLFRMLCVCIIGCAIHFVVVAHRGRHHRNNHISCKTYETIIFTINGFIVYYIDVCKQSLLEHHICWNHRCAWTTM